MALTDELSEVQRHVSQLKDQAFECDQKLLKLQKTVCEVKKKSEHTNVVALGVCVLLSAIVFIGLAAMYLSGKYLSCAICSFLSLDLLRLCLYLFMTFFKNF